MNNCPCHSGKTYEECCRPFHQGVLPDTPLQLMRSRYAAYALDMPEYIIETTHPDNPNYTTDSKSISQFSRATTFANLEILESAEDTVVFTAYLQQGSQDASFTEKSLFEKHQGRWLYRIGTTS